MEHIDLLEEFINLADIKESYDEIWREKPVDLLTFFRSEDYLGENPYPGKQTELLETINKILWYKFTGDEKLCPEDLRKINEVVVLFGKGSGKDFLISGIIAYICYLLLCMNDPHKYFGFGKEEPIDIVNIAINAYQANNVFFKKLKARLNNCKWFKKVNYNPSENPFAKPNEFQITKNQIRFYRNITAHSTHSEAESFEGFNPLVIIFDEIGGFDLKTAENCYSIFRSSALSRFNDKMLLIFISYPRSSDDFIMKKFYEAQQPENKEVWAIKGKSWEVNPKIDRKMLDKDYEKDPELAKTMYECIPPVYRDVFFQFPDKIDECVIKGKKAQCSNLIVSEKITTRRLANGEERYYIGLEIFNLNLDPQYIYYIGGDAGVMTDSYIITLYHAEPVLIETIENGVVIQKWFNKPIEDLILEWRPSKKDKLPVDLLNVADILEMICRKVFVKKALFDKFNSAEIVQRLINLGVEAEDKNWSNQFQLTIYQNMKNLIYSGLVSFLDYQSMYPDVLSPNEELKAIRIINGNKIDHDRDKAKDFSDARAAAIWICSTDEPVISKHTAVPEIIPLKKK